MKEHIDLDDLGYLADKGWKDLSAKLDHKLPVNAPTPSSFPYRKVAVVLALLCGVLLLSVMLAKQQPRETFQPVPKIVNHITFDVKQPDIVINRSAPANPTRIVYLTEKTNTTPITSKATIFESVTNLDNQNNNGGLRYINYGKHTKRLKTILSPIQSELSNVSFDGSQVDLMKSENDDRHVRLGVNINSATHGYFQSASVGGGISVSFPIGKRFSVEPGVGYDMMRFKELDVPDSDESVFSLARAVMATPSLDVKYRVRKSIALPVSVHYQPTNHLAVTGGFDVGLLISQRMIFESDDLNYSGFSSYKKQLNESELNQLNRVNIGAHGGVSWFPTIDWKLGLYYGQNLTAEKKIKQKKLRFSNHVFKVHMARYF